MGGRTKIEKDGDMGRLKNGWVENLDGWTAGKTGGWKEK